MLEALWTVEFVSNQKVFGTGVVVFETGRVFGGDNQYYYIGNYIVDNQAVSGEVEVFHHSGEGYSVFGSLKQFKLKLSGKPMPDIFEMYGHLVNEPNQKIVVRFTRRTELP